MRKLFLGAMVLMFCLTSTGIGFAYDKEINSLCTAIGDKITKTGKKTVAVVDFTDLQGNITELGRFLAEELSVDLTNTAINFEVIDRAHLKSILAEHKLSLSGLIDPNNVKKLGQIAGVDAIITGTVTPFGDSIRVSSKVITTDSAKVLGASKCDIAKTKAIDELLAKGIETRVEASPATVSSAPAPKPVMGKQSVEVENFLFELQGCRLSGQSVTCALMITNKSKDRNASIYANASAESRFFDNAGNQFTANMAKLGNKEATDRVDNMLVENVPTKVVLTFGNVDSQPESISLLDIGGLVYQSTYFHAQIRNIPLSK